MDYRAVVNRIGLNILTTAPSIPDYHLMIGSAEQLASQPIMTFEDFMPKQVAKLLPDITDMTYEDVQENLASGKLTINDFFTNVYPLGDALVK